VRCANKALFLPIIAYGTACRIDPRAEVRFGNDAPVPYGGKQIVLADDALTIADEVLEEVEDLRLEGDQRAAAPQLAPCRIQREIFKGVEQCTTPLMREVSTPTRALIEPDTQDHGGQVC
jgi:hypothetical protein